MIGPAGLSRLGGSLLAQGAAGAEPRNGWDVLRHDVIPVAAAYAVFLGILIAYRRATRPSHGTGSTALELRRRGAVSRAGGANGAAPRPSDLLPYLAALVSGGYVFFLAIVVVFYFVLGGEDWEFIRQALVEGSLLAFALVLPAFVVLTWLEGLLRRHGGGSAKR